MLNAFLIYQNYIDKQNFILDLLLKICEPAYFSFAVVIYVITKKTAGNIFSFPVSFVYFYFLPVAMCLALPPLPFLNKARKCTEDHLLKKCITLL